MMTRQDIRQLTVIYDPDCEFCRHCVRWLADEPAYIRLKFVPKNAPGLELKFPGLGILKAAVTPKGQSPDDLLAVVDDRGGVYLGDRAFVMCLYALKKHRETALKLTTPALWPIARNFFLALSKNRRELAEILYGAPQ